MSRRLWVGTILLAAPSVLTAQKPTAIPLLPAANWRLVSSEELGVEAVRRWGGEPAVEREYGVRSVERRVYRLNGRDVEAIVAQASDSTSAYGLLTFYQSEQMSPERGFRFTVSGPASALMCRGRFFIRVFRPLGWSISESDFRALLIYIGGTQPQTDFLASLPVALPPAGLLPGSEKYVLGLEAARRLLPSFRSDFLGFAQGAELQFGTYQAGSSRATVLAVTYPTPQSARIYYGAMEKLLRLNEDRGPESVYGRRTGSFVFLVLGADSRRIAERLLDGFRVSKGLSWDERYPGEQPITLQLLKLILANIIFCAMLVGLAILGGLLIVLSRRLAARWAPDSSWGHPGEGSIIRLNLR